MKGYSAYVLTTISQDELLEVFPPKYDMVYAHHITHRFGIKEPEIPPDETCYVVGIADSGDGIQALVVNVGGSIYRPDGKIYHITWSIQHGPGYRPKDSNNIIEKYGYEEVLPSRVKLVEVVPRFIPFNSM